MYTQEISKPFSPATAPEMLVGIC